MSGFSSSSVTVIGNVTPSQFMKSMSWPSFASKR